MTLGLKLCVKMADSIACEIPIYNKYLWTKLFYSSSNFDYFILTQLNFLVCLVTYRVQSNNFKIWTEFAAVSNPLWW